MQEPSFFSGYVVPALAVWGAMLSTALAAMQVWRSRRNIKVDISHSIPTYEEHLGQAYVTVEAINVGPRPVVIEQLALTMPDGKRIVATADGELPNTRFPANLADGEKCQVHISYLGLAEALVKEWGDQIAKLVPVCVDTAGRVHRGQAWKTDANTLLSAD